jgi:hypothetical protein
MRQNQRMLLVDIFKDELRMNKTINRLEYDENLFSR